jgi:hypothetical protein
MNQKNNGELYIKQNYKIIVFGLFIILIAGCVSTKTKTCKDYAKEVIPTYIPLSDSFDQQKFTWKDGSSVLFFTPLGSDISYSVFGNGLRKCFREASNEGENINYLYYDGHTLFCDAKSMKYSKIVYDSNGKILGRNEFEIRPILAPTKFYINVSMKNKNQIVISWSGIEKEILNEIYNTSSIKLQLIKEEIKGIEKINETIIFETEIKNESGLITYTIKDEDLIAPTCKSLPCTSYNFKILSNIQYDNKNKIYKIIDPNFVSCIWTLEDGTKIYD